MAIWCTKRGKRLRPEYGHQQSVEVCLAACPLRERCPNFANASPETIRRADRALIKSGRSIDLPLLEVQA